MNFTMVDGVRGETICNGKDNKGCGTVMVDHMVNHGSEKRNFEGEEVSFSLHFLSLDFSSSLCTPCKYTNRTEIIMAQLQTSSCLML